MTARRPGAMPDPSLTDRCSRYGCGCIEGNHLLCGCVGCGTCPEFLPAIPTCKFCGEQFRYDWLRVYHERKRPEQCHRIADRRAKDKAAADLAREYRTTRKKVGR